MKAWNAAALGLFVGVAVMWVGGDRVKAFFHRDACGCPTPHGEAVSVATATLDAWEPIDESFRGCEQSCGSRASAAEDGVVVQAASAQAKIGDKVYCPVSGVVFTVSAQSAHRDVGGKTVYFCCESCAAYFTANQARVVASRGMNPA